MRRSSATSALLLALCLAAGAARGQWSEPVAFFARTDSTSLDELQILQGPGDSVRLIYVLAKERRPYYWSLQIQSNASGGDTWSEPESVTAPDTMADGGYHGLGFGLDALGREWLSWYRGNAYVADQEDSWAICTTFRDSLGWRRFTKTLCPYYAYQTRGVAVDRQGRSYLALDRMHFDPPGCFTDAMYSLLDGDTWCRPSLIDAGMGRPCQTSQGCPILVPHPEVGVWAVSERAGYLLWNTVRVYRVVGDSSWQVLEFRGSYSDASLDSTGRLWVVSVDSGSLKYRVIAESAVVECGVIAYGVYDYHQPYLCADPSGWVWAAWNHADRTCGAAYNWGAGWSTPEYITINNATVTGLASSGSGRIYASLTMGTQDTWRCYTCYRPLRPSLEAPSSRHGCPVVRSTKVVSGMLFLPPSLNPLLTQSLLGVSGRTVMSLSPGPNDVRRLAPGVYFVREAVDKGASDRVGKIVVTR